MKQVCVYVLAAALIINLLTSCKMNTEFEAEHKDAMSLAAEQYDLLEADSLQNSAVTDMKLVAQNNRYQLCLNFKTTDFALIDKKTNQILYSNPILEDPSISIDDDIRGDWISNLVISYNDKTKNEYTYNSNTDCIDYGQFQVLSIKNGVRIVYKLGKDETQSLLPPVLDVETYESIYTQLTPQKQKALKACYTLLESKVMTNGEKVSYIDKDKYLNMYPLLRKTDLYVSRDLTAYQKKQLQIIMQEVGFTYEDMQRQFEKAGYKAEDESVSFVIPLDITLSDDGFDATVNADLISVTSGYSLHKISVLCGLGAGTKDGNFLVPDGTGALIPMVNENGSVYSQPVYGNDETHIDFKKKLDSAQVILPVYACITKQSSLLTAVTSGDAVATITTKQKGGNNPVATAYTTFIYTDKDDRNADKPTSIVSMVTARNHTHGKFGLHYLFTNREVNYAQLAITYRTFLESKGLLTRKKSDDNNRFIIDLYGSIDKKGYVFGVPAIIHQELTTFSQAEDILNYFVENDVSNISVRYLGMVNNGLRNSVSNKFDIMGNLGGKKEYQKLLEFAQKNNISIYPNLNLNYVYKDKIFDGFSSSANVSKRMDYKNATLTEVSFADGKETENLFRYVISPKTLFDNARMLVKDLKKQKQHTVALSTTGQSLNSDFSKENFASRVDAQKYTVDALKMFKDQGLSIIVETGNLYALSYSQTVVNLPNGHSGLNIEKSCIPFVQIVLSGYVDYTSMSFNRSNNIKQAELKAIETGEIVYYSFMSADNIVLKNTEYENLNSINFSTWAKVALQSYHNVSKALSEVKDAQIVDHQTLNDMISKTVYDNGVSIYVNYSDSDYSVDNLTIPAQGYAIGGAQEK